MSDDVSQDARREANAEILDEAAEVNITVQGAVRFSIIGIFLLMLVGALYFAQDFLLPVSLAFLFAMVLSPIVRALARKGLPEGVTAVILVALLVAGVGAGAYGLSGPVTQMVADAPEMAREAREKLAMFRQPMEAVEEASDQVEEITTQDDDPTVQRVVVSEPGLISRAATGAAEAAAKIALTIVLLLFLLASGEMFYEKLVKALPTMSDKKRALRIARDVQQEVSRYLFTITLINLCLGIAIAACMAFVGIPNPVLWGVLGAVLNFIPYIGAVIGIVLVGGVALVTFDTLGAALLAPALYALCTSVEGQFITPMVVGRRLELNAVAVFTAVAFWGWLWGIVGALIAVPLLVTVKVFSDHVEGLDGLGQFLGGREHAPAPEEEKPANPV